MVCRFNIYKSIMNSSLILSAINQDVLLDENESRFLESILISRPFKRGELIVESGETARYMMFVNKGYIMTYYTDKDGGERVLHFAATGWWCGDIYSLSDNPTTIYATKGLTDGELLFLPRSAQDQLFEKYPKFDRFFRIFFQNSLIRQQLRFIENFAYSAEERYDSFKIRYPGMEQFVPQKYIASYLGITPEFLSKIRKRAVERAS
jgi:CRP/FNR family transcriptional regulator, anaerobic regulatory protein